MVLGNKKFLLEPDNFGIWKINLNFDPSTCSILIHGEICHQKFETIIRCTVKYRVLSSKK